MADPFEFHVVISPRRETAASGPDGAYYPVSALLTLPSRSEALKGSGHLPAGALLALVEEWEQGLPEQSSVVRAAQAASTTRKLSDLLFSEELDYLFALAREEMSAVSGPLSLKLEVVPIEVQRVPWELLFAWEKIDFVRFFSVSARPPALPLSLPIEALVLLPGPWFTLDAAHRFNLRAMLEERFPHLRDRLPEHGLRPRQAEIGGVHDVLRAMDGQTADILHLVLPSSPYTRERGALQVGPNPSRDRLPAAVLDGLLHEAGTRLLILHDPTPDGSAAPGLWQLAGQLLHAGGPPTLVARFPYAPQAVQEYFTWLYQDIIHADGISPSFHSYCLDQKYEAGAQAWTAFFTREGGDKTLHLSQLLERFKAGVGEDAAAAAKLIAASEALQERREALGIPIEREFGPDRVFTAGRTIDEIAKGTEELVLDYSHETRGLLPLAGEQKSISEARRSRAEAEAAVEELRALVEEATARRQTRFLNTCFHQSRPGPQGDGAEIGDLLPAESTLKYGRTYFLAVDISPDSTGSHAVDEIEWPDSALPDKELAEAQGGRSLRVALFSPHFTLIEDQKPLWLPLYGPTQQLHFEVVSPRKLIRAEIRICVYYKNNLVQSRMVYAQIGRSERTDAGQGNWSEVEYTLSASFGDLDQLQRRELNIAFNQSGDGTHALLVRGEGFKDNVFDLRDEMSQALTDFREALSCIMFIAEDSGNYRLNRRRGDPNWGTKQTLETDLRELAHRGSQWYRALFSAGKRDLEKALRTALNQPSTIQVIRVKEKQAFPWSMIYDLPLVRADTNRVCLEFHKHASPGGRLNYGACLAGCPHLNRERNTLEHDFDVVCVFGFWGIKHMVEQPLSASTKLEEEAKGQNRRPSSIATVIQFGGTPVLGVGVSLNTRLLQRHMKALQEWIDQESAFHPFVTDESLKAIGDGLQRTPLQAYYLYCHGGRSGKEVWLSVGQREKIKPDHLRDAWKLDSKWIEGQPPNAPLIFLNGCGTLSISPESIVEFLQEFAYVGAAGVIGTEISVDERLAQEVGLEFLKAFADGRKVGEIIRDLRHRLLLKNNPLGLVYTPYCYSDLHMQSA